MTPLGSEVTASARIVVRAPNWIGDAVMAIPAIRDLRRNYPESKLVVATRAEVAPLFGLVTEVDEVIALRGGTSPGALVGDRRRLAGERFDLALLFTNSFASALAVRGAGVPERWGYAASGRRPLLTRAVPRPPAATHQADYYSELLRRLGLCAGGGDGSLAPDERARSAACALLLGHGWREGGPLVAFAPGAAYGSAKRWPAASYARLADRLAAELGATVMLLGSAPDRAVIAALGAALERARPIDLCGETDLRTLIGVLACSNVLVSNDSGTMHLGAAVGLPVVAIFGPTDETRTAPRVANVRVVRRQVECSPCLLRECPIDHRCMTRIGPDEVADVVAGLWRPAALRTSMSRLGGGRA